MLPAHKSALSNFNNQDGGTRHQLALDLEDLALGILVVGHETFGSVAAFERREDGCLVDVVCWVGRLPAGGDWNFQSLDPGFGVLMEYETLISQTEESHILISGGSDLELAGGDYFLFALCGKLSERAAETELVVNREAPYLIRHEGRAFFCVPRLLSVAEATDYQVHLEDRFGAPNEKDS
jgi:hypothetical protein